MKLLLDSCISKYAVHDLVNAGFDVLWVPDVGKDPGDEKILEMAREEQRILVTLDKDFGELAFVFDLPHPAVIRLVDIRPRDQGKVIKSLIESYRDILSGNPFITVDCNRVRIRSSDD